MQVFSFLADAGISLRLFLIVLVLVIGAVYYVYFKVLKKQIHKNLFIGGLVVLFIVVVGLIQSLNVVSFEGEKFEKGEWQPHFVLALAEAGFDPSEDLANTVYYDYENPVVSDVADRIAKESRSAGEAISEVLRYVYDNVKYDSEESDIACFEGTAPGIIEKGTGQCDTQSIVVISMLRRMGIPARPVGGCVVQRPGACLFQSLFLQSFQDLGYAPRFSTDPVVEGQDSFARGEEVPKGVGRAGGLHAWVVAWIPEEGWVHLEATTGKRVNSACFIYHVELFPENHQKSDICVSKNFQYAMACRSNNLELLDKEGLGVIEEVVVR